MTRITKLIALTAFSLMILALPSVASAQWRDRDRDRGRNDDYYGNSRYNRDIRGTLQNLKNSSRNFERNVDRMDNRRNDRYGRNNNRNLENLAKDFRKASDRLLDKYGNGRNLNGSRDEARRVLDIGNQIENELSRMRGDRYLTNDWNRIRGDLRVVADVYGYGNYRNGRSGDWRNRVPFPLPF